MKPLVSIVIPTYNRLDLTRQCLRAVRANGAHVPYEVVVTDDGSTDGTRQFLEQQQAKGRLRAVLNTENLRFARNCNVGAAAALGKYLVFLNNDTVPHANWLDALVATAQSEPRVGIVGSRLLYPDGTIQHAGVAFQEQGLPFHVHRGVRRNDERVTQSRDYPAVTGACLLIRRDLFEEVGGFDESYQMYVEDIELCLRVWEVGFSVRYCAQSVLTHLENASVQSTAWRDVRVREGWRRLHERWAGRWPADVRMLSFPVRLPDPQKPALLVWSSPLLDGTGYADEARNFLLGLDRLGVDVRAEPIRWSNWDLPLSQADVTALKRQVESPAAPEYVRVQHISPLHFRRDPGAVATVGRTMYETDGLPHDWVSKCNALDEIWVPTRFNVETFSRAGVEPSKLRQVPGAIDGDLFRRNLPPLDVDLGTGFKFLSIFDWIPRKGWDVLLRAYIEEFRPGEDVRLVLKAYCADGSAGQQQELLRRLESYVRDVLGCDPSRIAPIRLLVGTYTSEQMVQLYRSADAYVMPSRGEGWGRPMMEAMACGLPTVATGWGGNTEFMTAENSYLVDYQLEPIPESVSAEAPWFAGQNWAEPSVRHLRKIMRQVFEDRDVARARGARAAAHVLEHYDRPVVARIVTAELERLLGRAVATTPVSWEGSQFVHHSLAHINRELSLQLINSGKVDLSIIPYEANQFGARVDPRFVALAERHVAEPTRPAAVHVRHQWPPRFDAPKSGAWVMIQPWEFGGLPASWVAPMRNQVDEVWVPSGWVRDCYIRSGVPADRVRVIPNGLDLSTYSAEGPRYPLKTKKSFKFLFVGGTIGRKGIDVLIDTYTRTFSADDDVCLVIKAAAVDTSYRGSNIESALRQIAAQPHAPEIEYLSTNLSDSEVASLYRACDALVHPYRGEGFGMPIAEAMACSRPVIVTGYGAALDFCNGDTAYLLAATETPVAAESVGLPASPAGYWWAEPDRADLARLMLHVVRNSTEAQEVGARARERMQAYSWDHIASLVTERITELASRTPRRFLQAVEPLPLEGRRSVAFLHEPRWDGDSWKEVLTSYCESFTADDDVTLVLLLDPDKGVSQREVVERITAMLDGRADTPDLLLVPDRLDDVRRAYAAVDWLVPNGDERELASAYSQGVRVLPDLNLASWRAAA